MTFLSKFPEPVRFIIVGIAASLTHLAVAKALVAVWVDNQSVLAINTVSFLIAFLISFLGHRYVTFQREGSAIRYMVVAILGFMLNNIIALATSYLGGGVFFSIVCGTIAAPAFVYLLSRIWAFRIERGEEA